MCLIETKRVRIARSGFSLVELLVVIGIISVLVGLLIPAIQSIRNASARTQNSNNIRQILIALNNYASVNNGAWPGYGNWQSNFLTPNSPQGNLLLNNTTKEDPNLARSNWIDGGALFQLLPYMDYADVYNNSYGPMLSGSVTESVSYVISGWQANTSYKPGDAVWAYVGQVYNAKTKKYDLLSPTAPPGTGLWGGAYLVCTTANLSGANINQDYTSWQILDSNIGYGTRTVTTTSNVITATINSGWQAGRNPVMIKTFRAVGDLSADFPGIDAPLSFPLLSDVASGGPLDVAKGGFLDQVETSNTAYITEGYTICNYDFQFVNQNGYRSWAGGSYYNGNNPYLTYPLSPMLSNVTLQNPDQGGWNYTLWAGAPGPTCPPAFKTSSGCRYSLNWACPTPGSCTEPSFPPCDGVNDPRPDCHIADWYGTSVAASKLNHTYFDDIPDPFACSMTVSGGNPGPPHSMVRGYINIGYLDGSVRLLSATADPSVVQAIINGVAANLNPNDF